MKRSQKEEMVKSFRDKGFIRVRDSLKAVQLMSTVDVIIDWDKSAESELSGARGGTRGEVGGERVTGGQSTVVT